MNIHGRPTLASILLSTAVLLLFSSHAPALDVDTEDQEPLEVRLGQAWRWRRIQTPALVSSINRMSSSKLGGFLLGGRAFQLDGVSLVEYEIPGHDLLARSWGMKILGLDSEICLFSRSRLVLLSPDGKLRTFDSGSVMTHPCSLPGGTMLVGIENRIEKITTAGLEPGFPAPPGITRIFGIGSSGDHLWITTDRGFFQFSDGAWKNHLALIEPTPTSQMVHVRTSGKWVWFLHHAETLHFRGHVWNGKKISPLEGYQSESGVWDAVGFPDGTLLIASKTGGLTVFRNGSWHPVHLPVASEESIRSIAFLEEGSSSRTGLLTIASESGQLFACDLDSRSWQVMNTSPLGLTGIVNALHRSRSGGVWVGCQAGIARFDGKTFTDIHRRVGETPLCTVTALYEDSRGHLWVGSGSHFKGALRFDGRTWFHHREKNGPGSSNVHAIRPGKNGDIWFLLLNDEAHRPGAARLAADGTWSQYSTADGLPSCRCYDLVISRDGATYIATLEGIARLEGSSFTAVPDASGNPLTDRTIALLAARDGSVWAGSSFRETRIIRIRDGKGKRQTGPVWKGIAAAAMCEDEAGRIWFSSRRGLFMFDGDLCHPVSNSPGIPTRCFWPVVPAEKGGGLWIGSLGRGLIRYQPTDRTPPASFNLKVHLKQDHDEARIAWQGRDPWESTPAAMLRYRYRINSGGWSSLRQETSAILAGLDLGEHTVEVQAVDLTGNYQVESTIEQCRFWLPPPWYASSLGMALIATTTLLLVLLSAMILGHRGALRRAAEQEHRALQASEEGYRTLVEEAEIILRRFGPEGEPIYISPQIQEVTGYSIKEILNDPDLLPSLIHPEDRHLAEPLFKARTQKTFARNEAEFRIRRRDGSMRWVLARQRPRLGLRGELKGHDLVALDMTERKKLEEDLERTREALLQSKKLESLGILAGGIAHDFNNLLVGVLGYAGLARLVLPPDSKALRHLTEIETAGNRAAELCRQLLAYSGRGKSKIRAIDLTELVQEMLHILEITSSGKSDLHTCLETPLPSVQADWAQLNQVVMNLVINASEAIEAQGGTVTIKTGTVMVDRKFLETAYIGKDRPEGRYVYLQVEDSGGGLDLENLDRIFDPFYTTKENGHGLGLSTVLGIVRGHNGILHVHGIPGQCSVFQVLLPLPPVDQLARPEEKPRGEPEPWATRRGKGTVLVVDDNPMVSAVARTALEEIGFSVMATFDGADGLAEFQNHQREIKAVLLDMNMPVMGGEEVLKEIRKRDAGIPVLLSSGFDEGEASIRFTEGRHTSFIQKPYSPEELTAALWDILPADQGE